MAMMAMTMTAVAMAAMSMATTTEAMAMMATITPNIACSAGRSPRSMPTMSGTRTAQTAVTGAMTLITPTESAR